VLAIDNIIHGCSSGGIVEALEDSIYPTRTDVESVGNNITESTPLFIDEGLDSLSDIASVNALTECYDNFDLDPLFVNPVAGDYHLQLNSPCVDRGHSDAPRRDRLDVDGQPIPIDGNGDGIALPDVGADEFKAQ
jgi:hypothetical protein